MRLSHRRRRWLTRKTKAVVTVEILRIFEPSPLRYFNYSRHTADGIRNFKIYEPPAPTPIINIDDFYLDFSLFYEFLFFWWIVHLNIIYVLYLLWQDVKQSCFTYFFENMNDRILKLTALFCSRNYNAFLTFQPPPPSATKTKLFLSRRRCAV